MSRYGTMKKGREARQRMEQQAVVLCRNLVSNVQDRLRRQLKEVVFCVRGLTAAAAVIEENLC